MYVDVPMDDINLHRSFKQLFLTLKGYAIYIKVMYYEIDQDPMCVFSLDTNFHFCRRTVLVANYLIAII